MKKLTLEWFKAALVRAIRTIAQTAVSMIAVGSAISEVNWTNIISVSLVAGLASILTSIATGLPEAGEADGTMIVKDYDDGSSTYRLELNDEVEGLGAKEAITFKVMHENAGARDQE